MSEIDHWEALFDSTYLRWMDIEGKGDITVTIEKIDRKVELTLRGGKKKKASVVTFKGASKQMVLNRTNTESIRDLYGDKPSQWIGKKITLHVTTTHMGRDVVNCIRIKAPA